MTLSYVDHGGAVAVATSAAPAYPATVLANDILVTNPHRIAPVGFAARALAIGPDAGDRVRITREELFALLDAMHAPDGSLCTPERPFTRDAARVASWICRSDHGGGADLHVREWQSLVAQFDRDNLWKTSAAVLP